MPQFYISANFQTSPRNHGRGVRWGVRYTNILIGLDWLIMKQEALGSIPAQSKCLFTPQVRCMVTKPANPKLVTRIDVK